MVDASEQPHIDPRLPIGTRINQNLPPPLFVHETPIMPPIMPKSDGKYH
jgi:hypothetical protein